MKKLATQITTLTALTSLLAQSTFAQTDAIGTLEAPKSIITQTSDVGPFFRTILLFLISLAGLWSLFQFVLGGFGYITGAGDAKKVAEAQQKFIHSITGLFIIAISFVLAALIGLIFFNDATFLLRPQFETIN